MLADLLKLSIAAQVALGSGYLAYLLAYAGIRQHDNTIDAIFKTLAFGLVATAIMAWTPLIAPARVLVAITSTVIVGAIWRWLIMGIVRSSLRNLGVHWADDIPTAWLSITAVRTDAYVAQIAVDLTDGRTLVCEDTRRFKGAPFDPCVFGLNGDLALYVTAELRQDGSWLEHTGVRNIDGDNLTYVPASAIKRVEIRHWTKRTNATVAEAAARWADVAEVSAATPA